MGAEPGTAAGITIRPFVAADLSACLEIFDSNVPGFFTPAERDEFRQDMESADSPMPYLLLLRDGEPVACGGLILGTTGRNASLSWGMVARAHHRQGLGARLLQARLDMARSIPGLTEVTLSTSQHSRGFYARSGFTLLRSIPDGFGPGMARCDMILRL